MEKNTIMDRGFPFVAQMERFFWPAYRMQGRSSGESTSLEVLAATILVVNHVVFELVSLSQIDVPEEH